MGDQLGLALVGPGAISAEHLRAFAAIGGTRNCWVVGRDPTTVRMFADEWGFPACATSLDRAVADPAVDVVLICSPNGLHATHAEQALLAGKHVIVEIPMAMSQGEARRLVDLAERVGRSIQVCHTMRSFAAIARMRDLVQTGEVEISQVVGYFGIPRRANEGVNGLRSWIDDLLWHHACHLVDASLWILGTDTVLHPTLHRGRDHPDLGMTMDISIAFATESAQLVSHALTYNTAHLDWSLRFVCDSGQYLFANGDLIGEDGSIVVSGAPIRDLRIQNRAMLDAIDTATVGDFDARSALPSMQCLQQLTDNHVERTS